MGDAVCNVMLSDDDDDDDDGVENLQVDGHSGSERILTRSFARLIFLEMDLDAGDVGTWVSTYARGTNIKMFNYDEKLKNVKNGLQHSMFANTELEIFASVPHIYRTESWLIYADLGHRYSPRCNSSSAI